ncbi:MAG: CHAT domain-containing protein [Deltaproteobacteria bacterium]
MAIAEVPRTAFVVALVALAACRDRSGADETRARVLVPRDRIRVAGCRQVTFDAEGLTCLRATKTSTVRVWVLPPTDAIVEARRDDRPIPAATPPDPAVKGWRAVDTTGSITVTVHPQWWRSVVRLIDTPPEPPSAPEDDADTREDDPTKWRPLAEQLAHWGSPARDVPWASAELEERWLLRAEALFAAGCEDGQALVSRQRLLYALRARGETDRALAVARLAWARAPVFVDGELYLLRERIAVYRTIGRLDDAADLVDRARALAPFSNQPRSTALVLAELLAVQERLGQEAAADATAERLERLLPALPPPSAAFVLASLGWSAYLRAETCRALGCAWRPSAERAADFLARALEHHEAREGDLAEVALDLGLVALLREDRAALTAALRRIAAGADVTHRSWLTMLRLRADLLSRPTSSSAVALEALARDVDDPELAWRAHLALGELAERRDDPAASVTHYLAAEARIQAWLADLALGAPRFGVRRLRVAAQRRLTTALVRLGRHDEALHHVRAARRATLAYALERPAPVEDRLAWCDDAALARQIDAPLPALVPAHRSPRPIESGAVPPDPQGGALFAIAGGASHLHGFLAVGGKTHHVDLGPSRPRDPREARATIGRALEAFGARLEGIDALYYLPTPASEPCAGRGRADRSCPRTALHTLPHPTKKGTLQDHFVVAEKLDINRPTRADRVRREALVVVDTFSSDLADGRTIGHMAEASLRDRGSEVEVVEGFADEDAFFDALGRAEHFHFTGHAVASPGGSALRLGPDLELDALRLVQWPGVAPRAVVLLGCGTGDGGALSAGLELGPAQALVIAGAEAVLATRRPVREAIATEVARCVYAGSGQVRTALRRCREAVAELDDFFLLVP